MESTWAVLFAFCKAASCNRVCWWESELLMSKFEHTSHSLMTGASSFSINACKYCRVFIMFWGRAIVSFEQRGGSTNGKIGRRSSIRYKCDRSGHATSAWDDERERRRGGVIVDVEGTSWQDYKAQSGSVIWDRIGKYLIYACSDTNRPLCFACNATESASLDFVVIQTAASHHVRCFRLVERILGPVDVSHCWRVH